MHSGGAFRAIAIADGAGAGIEDNLPGADAVDIKIGRRGRWVLGTAAAMALAAWPGSAALARAGWYVPGTGGFNPNVPDFYQHQDWVSTGVAGAESSNGWESATDLPNGAWSGWCYYVA